MWLRKRPNPDLTAGFPHLFHGRVRGLAAPTKRLYTFGRRRGPSPLPPFIYASKYASAYSTAAGRAHRLEAQDVALSRRKQGFDSPWARQSNQHVAKVS